MRVIDRWNVTGKMSPFGPIERSVGRGKIESILDIIATESESSVRIDIQNVADFMASHPKDNVGWNIYEDFPNPRPPFDSIWFEYENVARNSLAVPCIKGEDGYYFFLLACTRDGKVHGPLASVCMQFDGKFRSDFGRITENETGMPLDAMMMPVYMALSFLNCKNVVLEDAPFIGPRQQRRVLERKGIKQAKFKTLVIEPMKQVLKTEGGIETNGLKKALHICRGHFATYSEDKPLFGRYSGTFWRPAHVRGNADNGTVYKDYKVKAPKE